MPLPVSTQLKLAACLGVGFVVYFATYTPQTAANLTSYLEQNGYAQVAVTGGTNSCGKGKRLFLFTGRNSQGASVAGEVCMDSHPFLYRVREIAG